MDKYILIQFYKPEKSTKWGIYYQQFPKVDVLKKILPKQGDY